MNAINIIMLCYIYNLIGSTLHVQDSTVTHCYNILHNCNIHYTLEYFCTSSDTIVHYTLKNAKLATCSYITQSCQ